MSAMYTLGIDVGSTASKCIILKDGAEIVAKENENAIELAKARYNVASTQLADKQKELADYQAETIKVIRGESRLDIDLLNDLVSKAKQEIQSLTATVDAAKLELEQH